MKGVKYVRNSKYLIFSVLLLILSIVVLSVNALGTSLAWFTDSDRINFDGNTATVTLHQYQGVSEIDSGDRIELTSTSSTPITVENDGSISVYLRVFITCNWKNISADYGNVSNFVTLGISSSNWYMPNGNIGEFIYYKGSVASGATKTIMSSITISSIPAGAEKVVLNVWAEAVQATDAGLTAIKPSTSTLSEFKTALGIAA